MSTLAKTTAKGLSWSYAAVLGSFVLQLAYTAAMSRLVDPRSFGLLAAALIGVRFLTYLSRFGLGSFVVQRESLTDSEIRMAFSLSLLIGAGAALATVVASFPVSRLMNLPDMGPVMGWMAVSVALGAAASVPDALLRRDMRFGNLAASQLTSTAVGYLLVGIPLALRGWEVWSLVAATAAQTAVQFLWLLLSSRNDLKPTLQLRGAGSMLSFGGWVAATGFVEFIGANIDTLMIGSRLGADSLGQYSRATSLVGLPIEQAATGTSRVFLPSLAQVQSDDQRFARALLGAMGTLSAVLALVVGYAAGTASVLVPLVLGDSWGEATRILPLVGVAYGLSMVVHVPAIAAEARGKVRLKFVVQAAVVLAFAGSAALVSLAHGGLTAYGAVWVGAEALRLCLYLVWIVPVLSLKRSQVLARYLGALLIGIVAWAVAAAVTHWVELNGLWKLTVAGLSSLGAAAGVLALPLGRLIRSDGTWVLGRLKGGRA